MIHLIDKNGMAILYEEWIGYAEATALFEKLKILPQWQQEKIKLFGKHIQCPRLTAWFGDIGVIYKYSGTTHVAAKWPSFLLELRNQLYKQFNISCNSVLCNLYRDGTDYMGWHSDNEKEIIPNSPIISISLGVTRTFQFRHKVTRQLVSTELKHGSVLIMEYAVQQYWQHRLPRSTKQNSCRINLTFRNISCGSHGLG